jgi:large subunit ribosomal protein L25
MQAQKREGRGKGVSRQLRFKGDVPAVIYGDGKDPQALALNARVTKKIIGSHAGDRTILNLKIDGESDQLAMIKDVQIKPITGNLVHIDLMRISESKKVEVTIPVRLLNIEEVRRLGGIVQQMRDEITVVCFPTDIPDEVSIDVSKYSVGSYVNVGELSVGENIDIVEDPSEMIASILLPRIQDEKEDAEATVEEPAPAKEKKPEKDQKSSK